MIIEIIEQYIKIDESNMYLYDFNNNDINLIFKNINNKYIVKVD